MAPPVRPHDKPQGVPQKVLRLISNRATATTYEQKCCLENIVDTRNFSQPQRYLIAKLGLYLPMFCQVVFVTYKECFSLNGYFPPRRKSFSKSFGAFRAHTFLIICIPSALRKSLNACKIWELLIFFSSSLELRKPDLHRFN